ncbi:MAG: type I restriction enzyme endonuclease domain-containing protein [Pseudonocardiaceae bacterium]
MKQRRLVHMDYHGSPDLIGPGELPDATQRADHGMAPALMGDDTLAKIARALVADLRKNLSIDWLSREPVRAKLSTRIRRLPATFDYPPEEEREAASVSPDLMC